MSGNVQEWCQDYYVEYAAHPNTLQVNPTGPKNRGYLREVPENEYDHHVVRGGGWDFFARITLVSLRYEYFPELLYDFNYGFRLLRTP